MARTTKSVKPAKKAAPAATNQARRGREKMALSDYLDKPPTAAQAHAIEWIKNEVGYDPTRAKTKAEAFEEGVRLCRATWMIWQKSPENQAELARRRSASGSTARRGRPGPLAADAEEAPPAKKATKKATKKAAPAAESEESAPKRRGRPPGKKAAGAATAPPAKRAKSAKATAKKAAAASEEASPPRARAKKTAAKKTAQPAPPPVDEVDEVADDDVPF